MSKVSLKSAGSALFWKAADYKAGVQVERNGWILHWDRLLGHYVIYNDRLRLQYFAKSLKGAVEVWERWSQ